MPSATPKIILLESVDSTNNYAMAMIQNGLAVDGNAVFARHQTHGKGRPGKVWKSRQGDNIILSILAKMQWLPVIRQFELSMSVALGCHDFISTQTSLTAAIKWPNDIFINDSKAGGILIENIIKGTLWQWAVIGVGININQVDFENFDMPPVSLKQVTGETYDVLQLAEELYRFIMKRIDDLKSSKSAALLEEYNAKLFGRNRWVKLKKEGIVIETKIIGVSSSGRLITQDACQREFNFGEVQFKGIL